MNESQIFYFVLSSLAVILIPGQDMLLVMSRGMTQGAKAGVVTAAGLGVGLLGHTLLAAIGLGALLMSSEFLFWVLKYMGGAYLVYLGVKLIVSDNTGFELQGAKPSPLGKLFVQGLLSNLSNPKVTIFYFAFLPQFVSAEMQSPAFFLVILGISFAALTFLIKGPLGFFAGFASVWIRSRPGVINLINKVSGTVLIGLGVKLAFEQR